MRDPALEQLLKSALEELRGDAIAIGVAVDDLTQFVSRGTLGAETVHERTVFYGASVTKQIVGVAAASALLRGAMDVDDSICRWVPELPSWMKTVKLDHLIHHTSDLPDVADPTAGVPKSNAEVIERFRLLDALRPSPGARYAYNNAGYVLLAEAVARSTQRPVADVAAQLFTPLGLNDTRLGGPAIRVPGVPDPPGTIGNGGLWTSVRDLTRWLQAGNRATFGVGLQQLVETTATLANGSPLDYAWGARVTPSRLGRIVTHGGSWATWLAKTVRIPGQGIAVAILSVGAAEVDVSRAGIDLATAIAGHTAGR